VGDIDLAKELTGSKAMAQSFCGTEYYMSPEIISGEEYSYPCDVWSCGCVLFEMTQLRKPFENKDKSKLYNSIKNEEVCDNLDDNTNFFFKKLLKK
jgi:serine/threonine protein kinase